MARTNGPISSPASLTASERRKEVMKMRVAGTQPREIAEELGITRKQVMADLRKVAQQNNAEAAVWNAVLVERADLMWRKLEPKIRKGDMWAMDRGFQALDRLKELTGADKVSTDSGAEIDKWLTGSVEGGGFEDDEEELLGPVIEEYEDLEPDDLDEQLDTVV